MKFLLAGSCLLLLYINAAIATEDTNSTLIKATTSKEADKLYYPKKVKSVKKTLLKTSLKKLADIPEKFRDLPADDLSFIKELDKQFKLHGDRIKIKVENNNATETKSSKRTIDGELGYGYNGYNGYQYDPPKFMFYPYSQKNIESSNAPNYFLDGNGKTEVTVEPSYSYELKSQSYITHSQPQIDIPKSEHYHAEQPGYTTAQKQQEYEEPVIVLRIPGPAKYATHLQMLLQKYLEIRAAQYLHILEEVEQRNHQQQHQLQQLDYGAEPDDYTKQTGHVHPNVGNTESVQHLEIDKVYQNYKNRYSSHREQAAQQPLMHIQPFYDSQQNEAEQQHVSPYEHLPQHQQHQQHHQHQQQQAHHQFQYQQNLPEHHSQLYYPTVQQSYTQTESPPVHTYQQVYLVPMMQPEEVDYKASQAQTESEPVYVQEQVNQHEHSLSLPVAENNPRPSHTKVVFTNKNQHSPYDYQMYQLPSIKPNERHAPSSQPDYHQDFQQPQYHDIEVKQVSQGSSANNPDTAGPEVMIIAQRPYNYHAHSAKVRFRGRSSHPKRTANKQEADAGYQKANDFIRNKLAAETGSAADLKTAQDTNAEN